MRVKREGEEGAPEGEGKEGGHTELLGSPNVNGTSELVPNATWLRQEMEGLEMRGEESLKGAPCYIMSILVTQIHHAQYLSFWKIQHQV